MKEKKLQKKLMPPVMLACSVFVLALVKNIFGFFSGMGSYWPIFPVLLLCILPSLLFLSQKCAMNLGKPLFYISFAFLGLQLLGNILLFFSSLFESHVPLFDFVNRIPGTGILSSVVWVIKAPLFMPCPAYWVPVSIHFAFFAISNILCVASNFCFLVVCSEYAGFHQLDGLRAKLNGQPKVRDNTARAYNGTRAGNQTMYTQPTREKEKTKMDYTATSQRSRKDAPAELLDRRSIAMAIILSLVTCGIYGIVWTYSIMKKIRLLNGDTSSVAGELLCYIFVPFYLFYWYYTRAERLAEGSAAYGVQVSNNGILYLLLSAFGLAVVSTCLMQNDLNTVADVLSGSSSRPNAGTQATAEFNNAFPNVTGSAKTTTGSASNGSQTNSAMEQLEKLTELHKQGVLTDEEFKVKKAEILSRI